MATLWRFPPHLRSYAFTRIHPDYRGSGVLMTSAAFSTVMTATGRSLRLADRREIIIQSGRDELCEETAQAER
jgi:hypothetical protein